ncbi:CPBP family intramembrane glutamic endopeptidase [Luteococcus peritonei]|uniref:CPBP family intramembrane glutamic endopeptidase n=1 Tax=Luteococcus peritonei TaxID=88874 RepID=A0ABW4RWM1_9ACTN
MAEPLAVPRPRRPVPPGLRRLLLAECAVVLGVSLGQSAIYSVLRIIERMTRPVALNQQTSTINQAATPDRPWLSAIYQLADTLFLFVPATLALYLLAAVARPAAGVAAVTGLARNRWRPDLAWGCAIFAAIGIPGLGLYLAARALGLNTTVQAAGLGEHWWSVPLLVLAALGNSVLEEVVMIGYLFTRFRQMRFAPWVVLVTSALIRGSYHLYQGFGGFLGNAVMGLAFGAWFLRTRRLWPLVVAHFLLDVASFVGYALLAGRLSWL